MGNSPGELADIYVAGELRLRSDAPVLFGPVATLPRRCREGPSSRPSELFEIHVPTSWSWAFPRSRAPVPAGVRRGPSEIDRPAQALTPALRTCFQNLCPHVVSVDVVRFAVNRFATSGGSWVWVRAIGRTGKPSSRPSAAFENCVPPRRRFKTNRSPGSAGVESRPGE